VFKSVDSEFKLKINNESARKNQVVASFGNPQHPSSVFGWGNLKTLKDTIDDDRLYEQVHEFRKRHYSAHRMALVIQARLPLEVLEVIFCLLKLIKKFKTLFFSGIGGETLL